MRDKVNFKRYGFKPLVCTVMFCLLLSFSFAQKEIDFRINLEEGACFEVQMATFSKGTSSMRGREQENIMESTNVLQYRVVKKTSDFYSLSFMYTDYFTKMIMGEREITSDPKTADKLNFLNPSTQISMMMNKPFSADVSPKGKVLSVKENKEIAKEFKAKTKKLSPALREQVYMMVPMSESEALVGYVERWASYIPASALKIGDKWTVQTDSITTIDYTFVTETESAYIIEGVGSKKGITKQEAMGVTMIITEEAEFTITIEFDKQTFLPRIITQEMESLRGMELPDMPTYSQPPSKSYSTLTIEIKSCNP